MRSQVVLITSENASFEKIADRKVFSLKDQALCSAGKTLSMTGFKLVSYGFHGCWSET